MKPSVSQEMRFRRTKYVLHGPWRGALLTTMSHSNTRWSPQIARFGRLHRPLSVPNGDLLYWAAWNFQSCTTLVNNLNFHDILRTGLIRWPWSVYSSFLASEALLFLNYENSGTSSMDDHFETGNRKNSRIHTSCGLSGLFALPAYSLTLYTNRNGVPVWHPSPHAPFDASGLTGKSESWSNRAWKGCKHVYWENLKRWQLLRQCRKR